MVMRVVRTWLVILFGSLPLASAHGQRRTAPTPDTALVRVLTDAARDVVTPPRAHLAPRATPFPWRITLPDTLAPTWRALHHALVRVLNARPLTSADTIHAFLVVTDVTVREHALSASLGVGLAWRCPNGTWMASSTGYRVYARRVRGQWQPAQADAELFADPAPCAVLSPTR